MLNSIRFTLIIVIISAFAFSGIKMAEPTNKVRISEPSKVVISPTNKILLQHDKVILQEKSNGMPGQSTRDCVDTDNGATDSYGDGCAGYTSYPSWCGNYDDGDFDSATMCCACGGGAVDGGDEAMAVSLRC